MQFPHIASKERSKAGKSCCNKVGVIHYGKEEKEGIVNQEKQGII